MNKKEEILKWLDQERIFEHYLGFFGWRKLFPNPLRNDKNPGCSFYRTSSGKVLFNDFAQGKQYDCFSIVQEMYGLTFPEALNKIETDLITDEQKTKIVPKKNPEGRSGDLRVVRELSKIEFQFIAKKWSKVEWTFFKNYGITIPTLRKYRVKSLSFIGVNNKTLFRSEEDNPLFGYLINDHIKAYRPKSISKANKWRNNLTDQDVEGLEQLELDSYKAGKKRLLIITKSLKDVMVLHEMGYDAIAGHSESSLINDDIIKNLVKRYRKIILLFDNDNAGKKGALKYTEKYGFRSIFLDLSKDISDCVLEHGFENAKAHIKLKLKKLENDFK